MTLRSGAVYDDAESVGSIFLDLRSLSLNHPAEFTQLVSLAHGMSDELSDAARRAADHYRFLEPPAVGSAPKLYDDVRDVIVSGTERLPGRVPRYTLRDPRASPTVE